MKIIPTPIPKDAVLDLLALLGGKQVVVDEGASVESTIQLVPKVLSIGTEQIAHPTNPDNVGMLIRLSPTPCRLVYKTANGNLALNVPSSFEVSGYPIIADILKSKTFQFGGVKITLYGFPPIIYVDSNPNSPYSELRIVWEGDSRRPRWEAFGWSGSINSVTINSQGIRPDIAKIPSMLEPLLTYAG